MKKLNRYFLALLLSVSATTALGEQVVYDQDLTLGKNFTSGSIRLTVTKAGGGYWCKIYGRAAHNGAGAATSNVVIPQLFRPKDTVHNPNVVGVIASSTVVYAAGSVQKVHVNIRDGSAVNVTATNTQISAEWFVKD